MRYRGRQQSKNLENRSVPRKIDNMRRYIVTDDQGNSLDTDDDFEKRDKYKTEAPYDPNQWINHGRNTKVDEIVLIGGSKKLEPVEQSERVKTRVMPPLPKPRPKVVITKDKPPVPLPRWKLRGPIKLSGPK